MIDIVPNKKVIISQDSDLNAKLYESWVVNPVFLRSSNHQRCANSHYSTIAIVAISN